MGKQKTGNCENFLGVSTNESRRSASKMGKEERAMFDGKYNKIYDSTAFRVGVNTVIFGVWLCTAFVLLSVR
jgi:hypothetical protein